MRPLPALPGPGTRDPLWRAPCVRRGWAEGLPGGSPPHWGEVTVPKGPGLRPR